MKVLKLAILSLAAVIFSEEVGAAQDPDYSGYAAALKRVKAGETVLLAVGVTAPNGYVAVSEVPTPLGPGLWRCYYDGGAKAVKLTVSSGCQSCSSCSQCDQCQNCPNGQCRPLNQQHRQQPRLAPYPVLPNLQHWLGGQPGGGGCVGGNCNRW